MKKGSRILILSPTAFPSITGNATTTERWRQSLVKKGHIVQVSATRNLNVAGLLGLIERFKPDIVHAYHAFHSGVLLLDPRIARVCEGLSIVVSLPGTDADLEGATQARRDIIIKVCRSAHAIGTQSTVIIEHLEQYLPQLVDRIFYIPKAPSEPGDHTFDLRVQGRCAPEDVLFFLPAGIRPVKGNLECLRAFQKVHQTNPAAKIVFSGHILDADYGGLFKREVDRSNDFARWIQSVPPAAMRSAYEGADVVLNCSFSEGLSNVLLEAISAGRPLLASDIPSTRQLIHNGNGAARCGLLYNLHDPDDLCRQALRLITDAPLRRSMSEAAKNKALTLPTPDDEVNALIHVYNTAWRREQNTCKA
ncbi:MAG TPA: glycosyltransferase [Syntrophorhabdaceae bacterium]|nr:glycosyltransferase [Syntrophorhabdaceae bacterium]HQM82897.1 glycosyltransferase [Syntrophorhabdaceae bacterium]